MKKLANCIDKLELMVMNEFKKIYKKNNIDRDLVDLLIFMNLKINLIGELFNEFIEDLSSKVKKKEGE